MGYHAGDRRFHSGAVIPDQWIPVVAGTELPMTTVALLVNADGGGGLTATAQTHTGAAVTLKNLTNGQKIEGRWKVVSTIAGGVELLAAVCLFH